MNKKFASFFAGYGMEPNGKNLYGIVNGYETNVALVQFDNVAPLRVHISFYAMDSQKREIEAAIRNLALKFFKMQFSPYGLSLGFNDMTYGRLLKRLPKILDEIYRILQENGALPHEFCPVCGNRFEESAQKCNIDGFQITIDSDCVQTINQVINTENQDFENAPNNYLKGFLGAFIGGLVGVLVSVALNIAGFVSAFSAIIAIALGSFLYQKFHGKPNKMMIVIVCLTSFVMLMATIPAIYIIVAGIAAKSEGVMISAIDAFRICMTSDEFARMFYADLALTGFFTLLGTGLIIFNLIQKIKRQKSL